MYLSRIVHSPPPPKTIPRAPRRSCPARYLMFLHTFLFVPRFPPHYELLHMFPCGSQRVVFASHCLVPTHCSLVPSRYQKFILFFPPPHIFNMTSYRWCNTSHLQTNKYMAHLIRPFCCPAERRDDQLIRSLLLKDCFPKSFLRFTLQQANAQSQAQCAVASFGLFLSLFISILPCFHLAPTQK